MGLSILGGLGGFNIEGQKVGGFFGAFEGFATNSDAIKSIVNYSLEGRELNASPMAIGDIQKKYNMVNFKLGELV